jgi:dTDP-4-amino-4,6-dideoxygalactose transaminase
MVAREWMQAATDILHTTQFIDDPVIENFEEAFAAYHSAPYCVAVNSGTDALRIALRVATEKLKGDVIIPAFSFVAAREAVIQTGNTPVYVDVDHKTYTLNADLVEEIEVPGKTVAVVPTSLYGQACKLPLASAPLVADQCQAAFAYPEARFNCFSFYPTKPLGAFGDGGAILCRNASDAEKCRSLRDHGRHHEYRSLHLTDGYTSRMHAFQAIALSLKLKYLAEFEDQRNVIATKYDIAFSGMNALLRIPKKQPNYHLYVIMTPRRDTLRDYLASEGIDTNMHYPHTLHPLPVARQLARECLSLPIWPGMTEEQVNDVIRAVRSFFNHA